MSPRQHGTHLSTPDKHGPTLIRRLVRLATAGSHHEAGRDQKDISSVRVSNVSGITEHNDGRPKEHLESSGKRWHTLKLGIVTLPALTCRLWDRSTFVDNLLRGWRRGTFARGQRS